MNEWDLNQWLHHLEYRHKDEIQLGLDRMKQVAEKMALESPDCPVITVTGTNGKGSTVAALEAVYHTAGYKVGAYTSPHLIHFNERIKVCREQISDDALCTAFSLIEQARGAIMLTYFETATLAALWYFKQHHLDLIILEIGIGGRLDAVNIIDPDVSVITTVDFDHQFYLGNTLELIGYEKACIMRQGRGFVYADLNPPVTVLETADRLATKAFYYQQDYSITEQDTTWDFVSPQRSIAQIPKPEIQLKSAAAALCTVIHLQDRLLVSDDAIKRAMTGLYVPGRLQLQRGSVNMLFDVSHNPQSVNLLAQRIKSLNPSGRVHAVFSALADKDIRAMIIPLRDCVHRWYPAQLDHKRAGSADFLREKFKEAEMSVDICYNSPLIAFQTALNQAITGDLIVVYGSFFTVGQVLATEYNRVEQEEIK